MVVSSYGDEMDSSREVKIKKDREENVHEKYVIIVEDIIDTGLTLEKFPVDYAGVDAIILVGLLRGSTVFLAERSRVRLYSSGSMARNPGDPSKSFVLRVYNCLTPLRARVVPITASKVLRRGNVSWVHRSMRSPIIDVSHAQWSHPERSRYQAIAAEASPGVRGRLSTLGLRRRRYSSNHT